MEITKGKKKFCVVFHITNRTGKNDILHFCMRVDSSFDKIEIIQFKINFAYLFYAFTNQ